MASIIDLFAGAGGLSLGAARAGFNVAAAVELDKFALETHSKNFPNSIHLATDVASYSGDTLMAAANLLRGELTGLIGGPPCQGFSTMGKRVISDTRNNLFHQFFRLVSETQPSFFLAENVPGLLNSQYDSIRFEALAQIDVTKYKILPPIEVKASLYGAPTVRKRFFFFGYNPDCFTQNFTIEDFAPSEAVEKIFVQTALLGLPSRIDSRWVTAEHGWRKIEDIGVGKFFDRVSNLVPDGIGDMESIERYFGYSTVSGCMGTRHSDELKKRYGALKHNEVDPISKSMRLDPVGFCPTLRAGTASDKGSFQAVRPIHFKSARVITPREAARLQGFPDWFAFHKTKWHSFRQIGNSVSPIVAEEILSRIYSKLKV